MAEEKWANKSMADRNSYYNNYKSFVLIHELKTYAKGSTVCL